MALDLSLKSSDWSVRRFMLCLVLLSGVAGYFRLAGLSQGLPESVHPDERPVVHRALYFFGGDLNPHLFSYPSFSMYATSGVLGGWLAGQFVTGQLHSVAEAKDLFLFHPERFYLVARRASALYGILMILLLFAWGRRYVGDRGALAAALLAALTPNLIMDSRVMKPDNLMTLVGLLSLLSACEAAARSSWRWLIAAAFLAGLAISTKYNAMPFLVPIAFVFLWRVRNDPRQKKILSEMLGLAFAVFAGFVIGTPYAILDYPTFHSHFLSQMHWNALGETAQQRQGLVANVKNLLAGVGGGTPYSYGYDALVALALPAQTGLSCLAAACAAAMAGIIIPQTIAFPRYFNAALPALFLATAPLLDRRFMPWKASSWIVGTIFILTLAASARDDFRLIDRSRLPETRQIAREWIVTHCPEGAKMVVDGGGPELPKTRRALEELLTKSEQGHQPKAELYRMQLAHFDPAQKHFDVYLPELPAVGTPDEILRNTRQTQRLQAVDGGMDALRRAGVSYLVISESETVPYAPGTPLARAFPAITRYYESLDTDPHSEILFDTRSQLCAGPRVRVYHVRP